MNVEEARVLAIECRKQLRSGKSWVDIYKDLTEEQKEDACHLTRAIGVQENGHSASDAHEFATSTTKKIGDARTTIGYFLEIHHVCCNYKNYEYLALKIRAAREHFASEGLRSKEEFTLILWDELVKRDLVEQCGKELLSILHPLDPVILIEKMGVVYKDEVEYPSNQDEEKIYLHTLLEYKLLDRMDPFLLIKMFPEVYEDKLFRKNFHPDAFWTKRVMSYIAGKDWARAWDELRRANHGIFHGAWQQDLRDPKYRGYFGATAKKIRDMVETLFEKMEDHGFEFEDPAKSFKSPRFARSYGKGASGRLRQVAGFDVAYYIDNPKVEMLPDEDAYRFSFSQAGHMALILGDHFRQEANRKKREKRERASAI